MSLTNSEFEKIKQAYDDLRSLHRKELEERLEKIYREHPSILENQQALNENAAARGKAAVCHDEALLSRLSDEREQLTETRAELLAGAGLTEQDFTAAVNCPLCSDTGFIDGKKCRCFRRRERELLYAHSRIDALLEEENFRMLRTDFYDRTAKPGEKSQYEVMLEVIENCRSFAEHFDEENRNLLFYGQTGVGKTFLTNCIAKELLDSGHSVLYFSAISLFDYFSESLAAEERKSPKNDVFELYGADLVIIDDLGTELRNTYTISRFFHLVNERLLAKKSTIISTNLSLSALSDLYSERTASRILSRFDPIRLTGEDLRIRIRLEG